MSGETELKPCPFCGGEACRLEASQTIAGTPMIKCHGCGCRFYNGTEDKWNRRNTPPGYELVPEGAKDAMTDAHRRLSDMLHDSNGCDCEMAHVCGLPELRSLTNKLSTILATRKDAPNAQG